MAKLKVNEKFPPQIYKTLPKIFNFQSKFFNFLNFMLPTIFCDNFVSVFFFNSVAFLMTYFHVIKNSGTYRITSYHADPFKFMLCDFSFT